MTTINDLAPYPRTASQATANNLVRSLAVDAQVAYRLSFDAATNEKQLAAATRFVQSYGIVKLLRAVIDHTTPTTADEIARDIWSDWEDGSCLGEWLWEWLNDYGIDTKAVDEIVHAELEQLKAKAAEEAQP